MKAEAAVKTAAVKADVDKPADAPAKTAEEVPAEDEEVSIVSLIGRCNVSKGLIGQYDISKGLIGQYDNTIYGE